MIDFIIYMFAYAVAHIITNAMFVISLLLVIGTGYIVITCIVIIGAGIWAGINWLIRQMD